MNKKLSEDISFGEWLRQRRHILDLTQQELADQIGCARITLRRIESGALKPSKELAQILLEKLGIPPSEHAAWLRFARRLSRLPERSADSFVSKPITNLPTSLTSFIGREKEQAEIFQLISKYRLVTLVGSGGVGKTRLSLKIGDQVLGDHAHGVWLVELAPILDPELVPRTTAIAIGLRDEPQRPIIGMLSDYLREKKMLVILDNCEHLLDACAQLVDILLKNCPDLKILGTSREALGIMGEATYHVPSLGLPDIDQLLENFRDYESVRLFEERAQLAQMGFSVSIKNASSVANICNQLDGIPLAIELAAARISMFSTEQLAERLRESFNLLTTGNRTALPRHQTLQAAIDWSYDLLSPAEQTLFQRLSVFVNGWTLEAAESIAGDANIKTEDILDLLSQLINKSLINTEEPQNETSYPIGRSLRYRMLETIRQYANERLVESNESNILRDSHLDYFLILAETAEPYLIRLEQLKWLARLDADYENLRAALEWSLSKESPEPSLRLCGALGRFWVIRCYWMEGSKWLESALTKVTRNPSEAEKVARVKALYHNAELADNLDDIERMKASAELSLTLAKQNLDKRDIAIARFYVGLTLFRHTNYGMARQLIEQSIAEFRELKDPYWESYSYNRGLSLFLLRETDQRYLEATVRNLELARNAGERLNLANSLLQYSRWFYDFNQLDNARQYQEEADGLIQQVGSNMSLDSRLFAEIAWLDGNIQKARSYFMEIQERFGLLGEKNIRSNVIANLGMLEIEDGDLNQAQLYLEQALITAQELENKMFIARRLAELGNLLYLQGNIEKYKQNFRESISLVKEDRRFQKATILILILNSLCFENPESSVRLLGAIDHFQVESEHPIKPLQKHYYGRAEAHARKALSDVVFESAFAEGQKMSLDEALDLALKTVEEM